MSVKTSIGWCDTTCNPIKGLCQGGCWYCYYSGERGMARRFKQNPELRLALSVFDRLPKTPKKVFLCSTNDYWGDWIPDEWREAIRGKTQEYPQHTFQFLTKHYSNLPKYSPYPDNWHIGITATNQKQYVEALPYITSIKVRLKFASFEPLLDQIMPSDWIVDNDGSMQDWAILRVAGIKWVIIGRLTGYGHKYDPKMKWIDEIVATCDKAGIPVFLKNNLQPLVDEVFKGATNYSSPILTPDNKLRQEMPK